MRWIFAETREELNFQIQTLENADCFWKIFKSESKQLEYLLKSKRFDEIDKWFSINFRINDIDLNWDMSFDGVQLILAISAGDNFTARPIAESIVERAPMIEGWKIASYNPPFADTFSNISDARIPGDWSDMIFDLQTEVDNVIDIHMYSSKFREDNLEEDKLAVVVISELLLGEELLDKWVGQFFSHSIESLQKNEVIFDSNFRKNFEHMIDKIKHTLPSKPYAELEEGSLSVFSPDKVKGRDLFESTLFPVIDSVNNRYIFHSCRFSNYLETFCYIKMQRTDNISADDSRRTIQIELDRLLKSNNLGACFGQGLSNSYVYWDLVLSDLDKSIALVSKFFSDRNIELPGWILFHDTYLENEWVELNSNSPAPVDKNGW